jgi:hypothetical protein
LLPELLEYRVVRDGAVRVDINAHLHDYHHDDDYHDAARRLGTAQPVDQWFLSLSYSGSQTKMGMSRLVNLR